MATQDITANILDKLFIHGTCTDDSLKDIVEPYETIENFPKEIKIENCILNNLNNLITADNKSQKLIILYNAIAKTIWNANPFGSGSYNNTYKI